MERSRGGPRFESGRRGAERLSDVEVQENLEELDKLLARLVEKSGDLDPEVKEAIRAKIQGILATLGLQSLDDIRGLMALHERVHQGVRNLPMPVGYPDKSDFEQRVLELIQATRPESLPGVPKNPLATDVASHGQNDWHALEGRGGKEITEYIYELGKVLSSELAYTVTFDEKDAIEIGEDWSVENGRHRAMTLRILGTDYVEEQNLDRWAKVRKEE